MKQIKLLVFLLSMISCSAMAQNRSGTANTGAQPVTVAQEKLDAIKSCGDLQNQLTGLFGKSFSLEDKKVVTQLQKNIADKNASICVRKNSLFALYGKDYAKHLSEIAESSSTTK